MDPLGLTSRRLPLARDELLAARPLLESLPFPVLEILADSLVHWMNAAAISEYGTEATKCFTLCHGYPSHCEEHGEACPMQQAVSSGEAATANHIHRGQEGLRPYNVIAVPLEHGGALELHVLLEDTISRDQLTGLYSRPFFDQLALRQVAAMERMEQPWGMMIADVDEFKRINDELGHKAGDLALRHVARVIAATVRAADTVGRWGGEEFSIFSPGSTREGCAEMAERLRLAVAQAEIEALEGRRVTVSIGVTQGRGASGGALEAAFLQADRALLQAKREGRNRVVAA